MPDRAEQPDLAGFDASLAAIAGMAAACDPALVPAAVIHEAKRRLIDSLGCALGAGELAQCRALAALATRAQPVRGSPAASLVGAGGRLLPELACLANAVMGRALEGNDVFPGSGHPSDCIWAVLAAGQACAAPGRRLLSGIALAYQVYQGLAEAWPLRAHGLDYVTYTAAASAAASAHVMQLPAAQIAHALSLAVSSGLALGATRKGQLSQWKNMAGPYAAHHGLFAALLAERGVTGPPAAVEGRAGLLALLQAPRGGAPVCAPPSVAGWHILQADLKCLLTEFHAQVPILAALDLGQRVRADDIAQLTVFSYAFTVDEIGSDPEKWHPTSRESADHSLPYMIAAAMVRGAFSEALFEPECLADPRIGRLLERIRIVEDPEYTRAFPAALPCRIEAIDHAGARHASHLALPRGHHNNPMSDAELEAKFGALARRALPEARIRNALRILWQCDQLPDAGPVLRAVRIRRLPAAPSPAAARPPRHG